MKSTREVLVVRGGGVIVKENTQAKERWANKALYKSTKRWLPFRFAVVTHTLASLNFFLFFLFFSLLSLPTEIFIQSCMITVSMKFRERRGTEGDAQREKFTTTYIHICSIDTSSVKERLQHTGDQTDGTSI